MSLPRSKNSLSTVPGLAGIEAPDLQLSHEHGVMVIAVHYAGETVAFRWRGRYLETFPRKRTLTAGMRLAALATADRLGVTLAA